MYYVCFLRTNTLPTVDFTLLEWNAKVAAGRTIEPNQELLMDYGRTETRAHGIGQT